MLADCLPAWHSAHRAVRPGPGISSVVSLSFLSSLRKGDPEGCVHRLQAGVRSVSPRVKRADSSQWPYSGRGRDLSLIRDGWSWKA